jgi:hypothetical protein
VETRYARGWATLLGTLIYAIGAVWIYSRGVESKPWVGQGIRFGFFLALITIVYDLSAAWNMMPVPGSLIVKWIIGEGLFASSSASSSPRSVNRNAPPEINQKVNLSTRRRIC